MRTYSNSIFVYHNFDAVHFYMIWPIVSNLSLYGRFTFILYGIKGCGNFRAFFKYAIKLSRNISIKNETKLWISMAKKGHYKP